MSSPESRIERTHQAVAELGMLAQQAMQMGNNEGEASTITNMIDQVLSRELDPNEAIQKAREIVDGKNEV